MKPIYELVVESTTFSNINAGQNLVTSLNITDKIGTVADTLDFVIAYDGSYSIPETKGKCEVSIGYADDHPSVVQTGLWKVGEFLIEEIGFNSSRAGKVVNVRAMSLPESPATAKSLQNSNTRQWQSYELKETTFATIVNEVCENAGLTARIDSDIASIEMPFTAQIGETDAEFLTTIASIRDAQVKYAGDIVVIVKKDKTTLPQIDIQANVNIQDYNHNTSTRSDIKQVEATYRDMDNSVKVVSVGNGEPKLVIKRLFPSEQMAQDAANSLLAHVLRNTEMLTITIPTLPNLRAESPVNLSGFDGNTDGLYIAYAVSHKLDSGGLMSTIQAKKRVA